MRTLLFLVLIVATSVLLVCCQKESSVDVAQPEPNPSPNDSIYLSEYVELDTTSVAGSDTAAKYVFSYDAKKRLTHVFFHSNAVLTSDMDYFYNGDDTLPYRTAETVNDGGNIYLDTMFYLYNAGFVSWDSSRTFRVAASQFIDISSATYNNSGTTTFVTVRSWYYSPFFPVNFSQANGMVSKTYQNGCIIDQTDTAMIYNITNANHYQLTYDNNPNPFYRLDIHYPVYGSLSNSFHAQKNNLKEEIASGLSGVLEHIQYAFTYRSDGYPLTVKKTDLLDPTRSRKGFLFYIK